MVTAPFRLRTYRLLRKVLIGFILVSIANVLFAYFFYTPKMYRITRANRELVLRYRILQDRIRTAQRQVDEIHERDNYVYRSLFATDTLDIEGIAEPYPASKYTSMADDDYAPLMVGTWMNIDRLARTLYAESVSLDELQQLSKDKEKMSAAIPAIWPIDRKSLHNNHIGAFNLRRIHPVLGYIRPHKGSTSAATAERPSTPREMRWSKSPPKAATTAATATWCCSTTPSATRRATPI